MNGMKFNASVILAVVLNFVALTWFLSQQNSKIESMWADVQELTDKIAIEENVKMKLDIAQLKKDISKMQKKDKTIERQHKEIFQLLLESGNQNQQNQKGFSYGG
tara:strand:+ start:396 stop:710 length:315 start_codon:yes stop_codon:yes gene_type:complete